MAKMIRPVVTAAFVLAAAGLLSGCAGALTQLPAGTLVLGSPHKGFVFGAGAGAGVEAYSAVSGRGVCTLQDALVTAAGAAVGAYGTGWLVLPQRGGLFVGFVKPI